MLTVALAYLYSSLELCEDIALVVTDFKNGISISSNSNNIFFLMHYYYLWYLW